MSLEVVLVVPVLMLLALFVLWAGRGGRAGLISDLAAEEAATAAALACEEGQDAACEDLVGTVLEARPGLDFLCIGGARPDPSPGFEGLVEGRFISFVDVADPLDPDTITEATGVGVFGVRFLCETDGAVAPLAGVFPTVTFRGQAAEVAIAQGRPRAKILPPASPADEGDPLVFTVRLDAPSPVGFALTYTIADISPYTDRGGDCTVAPVPDYEEPPLRTVTFGQGDIEQTIRIETCNDSLYEADEGIQLTLDPPPPLDPLDPNSPPVVVIDTGAGDHIATGTITDDDPVPAVTVADSSEREGSGNLRFQVVVPGPIGRDITVSYNTVGVFVNPVPPGIATPGAGGTCASLIGIGADFRAVANGSHIFRPTDPLPLTHDVDVEVCDDLTGEPAETLELAWDAGPAGTGTATGTVEDDEPRLQILDGCPTDSAHEVCAPEDAGSATFTVQRRMHPQVTSTPPEVTVHYVTRPIDPNAGVFHFAAAGGAPTDVSDPCSSPPGATLTVTPSGRNHDYVPQSGELTIPAGTTQTTAPVTVMINDDGLDEHDESFRLLLCRPSDNAFVDDPWGRAIISDDDVPPTVIVSDAEAAEPATAADSTELVFTASLSAVSGRDVHLDYHADRDDCYVPAGSAPADVQALTASPGVDFDAGPCQPPTRVTIWAESDPPTLDIPVPVLHDELYEPDTDPATPDPHTETLALRVAATNAGFADTTRSCAPHDPADLVDPDNNLDNDCALGAIVDADSPPELTVSGQCAPADATLVVPPEVVACAAEGDDVVFELRLDRMSSRPVEVDWAVVPVAAATPVPAVVPPVGRARLADFAGPLPSDTATITALSQSTTLVVPSFDDSLDEHGLELFELHVSVSEGAVVAAGHETSVGAVEDDDDPPALRVLDTCIVDSQLPLDQQWPLAVAQAGQACANEGGGQIVFTVGLDNPSGREVTVLWRTQDKSTGDASLRAAGGADYTTVNAGRVTIPIGSPATATFAVQIDDDGIDERDEQFLVHMREDPANPAVVQFPPNPRGQGVIVDDDTTELSVAVGCTQTVLGVSGDPLVVHGCADEDDPDANIEFTVQLSQRSSQTVTVEYYTQDLTSQGLRAATAGSDYTAHASTPAGSRQKLTIAPPDTTGTIEVQIVDDDVYEHDEVFQLRLADPSDNTPMNASLPLAASRALGAIVDDDDPPVLSVSGRCTPADAALVVPAGVVACAVEGAEATFEVRLDVLSSRPVEVDWAVGLVAGAAGLADFVAPPLLPPPPLPSGTVTIAANTQLATFGVASFDDRFDEHGFELFELHVSVSEGAVVAAGHETSVGAVEDNDDPPALRVLDACDGPADVSTFGQAAVDAGDACVNEDDPGGRMLFRVGLFDPDSPNTPLASGREVTVLWETRPSGLAPAEQQAAGGLLGQPGADYVTVDTNTDPADRRITIRAGRLREDFTVQINDDDIDETDELFLVEVTADPAAPLTDPVVSFGDPRGQGVIVDDDTTELSVAVGCTQTVLGVSGDPLVVHGCADEDDPDANIEFTVQLSQRSSQTVTVEYYTQDLTSQGLRAATAGSDYTAHASTPAGSRQKLTIAPPDTTGTIEVQIVDDDVYEHDEVFQLRLADPSDNTPMNASLPLAASRALGAIVDDDDPPRLSITDATAEEDNVVEFTATLLKPSSNARADIGRMVTVEWSTADGTATTGAGGDYSAVTGAMLTFDPTAAGSARTQQTASVTILDDDLDETDETFELRVTGVTPAEIVPGTGAMPCDAEDSIRGDVFDDCAVGTITDNDPMPQVHVEAVEADEGDPLMFTVRLVDPTDTTQDLASGREVTVTYETRPGTGDGAASARAQGQLCDVQVPVFGTAYDYDYDYIAASGTLTFGPDDPNVGERTAQPVTVTTCDDWHDELDAETLTLSITAATGADLPAGLAAAGTIRDNEALPVAVIVDATPGDPDNHATAQEGDPVPFTVRLVNADVTGRAAPSVHEVTVPYHTFSTGTGNLDATGGTPGPPRDPPDADYEHVPANTLAADFDARAFEARIDIATFTDTAADSGERFQLHLDTPTNAQRDPLIGVGNITDGCIDPSEYQDGDRVPPLDADEVTVGESDGSVTVTFTVDATFCRDVWFEVTNLYPDLYPDLDPGLDPGLRASRHYDYYIGGSVLRLFSGARSREFSVPIRHDTIDEFDEWFAAHVRYNSADDSLPEAYHAYEGTIAIVTIEDDDLEPVVQVFGPADSDGNPVAIAEGGDVNFAVRLAHPGAQGRDDPSVVSGKPVSVQYYTCCDTSTATPGDDYEPVPQSPPATLTFPAAQSPSVLPTEHTFGIEAYVDGVAEGEESFLVRLALPQTLADAENAVLDNARVAVGTIDDDPMPQVHVEAVEAVEGDPLVFTVRLVDPTDTTQDLASGQVVTVTYETRPGTGDGAASARPQGQLCDVQVPVFGTAYDYDYDYIAASGTLTFGPDDPNVGERTAQTVTVTTCDDWHDELDAETLTLSITAATGADLPAGLAAAGTIRDDEALPVAVIVDATPGDPDNHATAQEGDPVPFTVRLVNADVSGRAAPSVHEVTVPYHTFSTGTGNLDATAGTAGPPRDPPDADYQHVPANTLAADFDARAFEARIDIATFTDTAADSGERFQLHLDTPTNAQRDPLIGVGNITDGCIDLSEYQDGDRVPPLDVDEVEVGESDGSATVTVTVDTAFCTTNVSVSVRSDHPDQTAAEGTGRDYFRVSCGCFIPAGSRSFTYDVPIYSDEIDEVDEWFASAVRYNPASAGLPDAYRNSEPVWARVTIRDDDPEPVVQVFGPADSDGNPVAIAEGGDVNFTVRLAHPDAQGRDDPAVVSGKPVSVQYYTCCDTSTATPGDDYEPVPPTTLTFPAEQYSDGRVPPTEHAFGIAAIVDGVTEVEESFLVRLALPQTLPDAANARLDNHRTAQGTITDGCINRANMYRISIPHILTSDETERENTHRNLAGTAYENPPPWGFPYWPSVGVLSGESVDLLAGTGWLPGPLCPGFDFEILYRTLDRTADFTDGGGGRTADAGDDFVAASGTLSGTTDSDGFLVDAQGDRIAVFVEVIDDHIDEAYYEQFDLWLGWGPSMPDAYGASWHFFGRIIDDDDLVVSVADASGTEGSPVRFEISATPSSRQVEVSYATMQLLEGDNIAVQAAGASCTGEADYVGAASSVVFAPVTDPGLYSAGDVVTMPVEIQTCPDDDDEEEDERFQLNISVDSPTSTTYADRVGATDNSATGTIRDCLDTTLALSGTTPPTLSTQDVTVREDPTGPTIEVPFTWSQRPCGDKAIRFEVVNVTATHNDDFTGPGGGSTFGLVDDYLEYTIVDDDEIEGEETFRVRMHFCRIGTSGACGPNSLDAFSYHPDYAALPVVEATVTIADNDCVDARSDTETPPRVTITPRNERWIEHDGAVQATFDLSRPLCEYATVGFTAVDGTAVHGQDFLHTSGGQGIPAGDTSFPLPFSLIDDNTIEGMETFYFDVQWSLLVPDSWQDETVRSTHNILDDDCISSYSPLDDRVPEMSFEYEETVVEEGDEFIAVASFDPPLCENFRITETFYFITVEPEDFGPNTRSDGDEWPRFLDGGTATRRSAVSTADDDVWEGDEQFRTVFNWHTDMCSRADKFCGQPAIENLLTIRDSACVSETEANDPDFQLELTIDAPSEVSEADGSYSVTLSLDSVFCDDVVLIHHADITGSDTASRDDVDALSDLSLSLTAPSQEQPQEQLPEQLIVIDHDTAHTPGSIVDDELDENDETFTFRAFLTLARTWVSEATVTIVDDDPVPLLVVDDVVLAEPVDDAEATMVFTVGLENLAGESIPSGREVRVGYATNPLGTTGEATEEDGCGDGADYVASSGELVFTPGVETRPVEVTICRDSDDTEPYERLQLVLERDPDIPSPVNADIRDHIGVGTIPGLATVSIRDSNQWAEGATYQGRLVRRFEVSVSGGLTEAATVQWATEDCTDTDPHCAHPATAGDDYTADSGTLNFDSDTTTGWIEVTVVDDELDEYDEVFFVRLTNPSSNIMLSGFTHPDPVGIGHIIDDDPLAVLSFEHAELTVDEGKSVNVHAVLDGPSGRPIVWRPSVAAPDDGPHATRNLDYTIDLSARTIEPGDTSDHVTVTALADTVDDDGERLEVVIGISTNVQWSFTAAPTALVTIVEPECASPDDSAPPLSVQSVEIEQGESGQIMVTSFPALCTDEPIPVNLDWRTTLVTAEAEDFSLSNGVVWGHQAVTFRGEFPFSVQTVVDDDSDDDIFRLEVRWRAPDSWAGASETYGTVTILDCVDPATDDAPVMSLPDAEVPEGTQARIPLTVSPALCETLPAGALEYRFVQFTSEVGDHLSVDEWRTSGEALVAGQPLWWQISTFDDDDFGDEIFFVEVRWSANGPASRWASEEPAVRSRITIRDS